MNHIAEATEPVHPAVLAERTRQRRAPERPMLWWCAAAGAACGTVVLNALFPESAAAWFTDAWRPETIAILLSSVMALTTWAATRSWAEKAERARHPLSDGLPSWRDLGRGVVNAAERRQYYLRRHLQVGVVRQLDGAAVLARLLEERLSQEDRPEASEVAKIRDLVERTICEARLLAASVHPPEIETGGLEEALRRMAAEAEKYQTYCQFIQTSSCPRADSATSLQLYRVVQVVVERAIRHGKPHHILVELTAGPERYLSMTVTDRVGHGDKLPELSETEICDIQARVSSVGGALHIERPAGGLRLTCSMMTKGPRLQP